MIELALGAMKKHKHGVSVAQELLGARKGRRTIELKHRLLQSARTYLGTRLPVVAGEAAGPNIWLILRSDVPTRF